ncbi:MAG TPA: hypothetical protein ENG55_00390 [Candidatus Omnitrophica bacterium]|nr:hypothetical protein [Candidatus Omnitrophota bacterium]
MGLKFNLFSIFRRKDSPEKEDRRYAKHNRFLKEQEAELKREKRQAKSIKEKILRSVNKDKEILTRENILGRIRGKPTHGPRGNKNE